MGNALRFVVASIAGAALVGISISLLGHWLLDRAAFGPSLSLTVGIVALVYAVGDLLHQPLPVPSGTWFVPRQWGALGDRVFAVTFGFVLGIGWLTMIPFIGFHLLLLQCGLNGDAIRGASLFAVFGLFRSLGLWMTARSLPAAPVYSSDMPSAVTRGHLDADRSRVKYLRNLCLVLVAVTSV